MGVRATVAALVVLLGVFLPAGAADRAAAPSGSARTVTCSFSHPSYSGFCRETRRVPENGTAAAVCNDLLRCLNDVRCVETLCQATTIRGGWKLERMEEQEEKK